MDGRRRGNSALDELCHGRQIDRPAPDRALCHLALGHRLDVRLQHGDLGRFGMESGNPN
jgi:hypothetical protein